MQAPCKDCPDRHYLCHSKCEKYIEYNKYREEVRKKRQEFYKEDFDYRYARRKGRKK